MRYSLSIHRDLRGVEVASRGVGSASFHDAKIKISLKDHLLLLIMVSSLILNSSSQISASGLSGGSPEMGRISLSISPPHLLADGGRHGCIFIQLQDLNGEPMPAPREVWVFLSSSNSEVGSVESPVVINEGEYLKTGYFRATHRPGETEITASASGFISGSAILRSFDPHASTSPPYSLRVYASPSLIPADYGMRGTVRVQIVDSEGAPIPALSDVEVTLTSSNASILELPSTLTIYRGANYGDVSFSTLGLVGRTTITALSEGFMPGNTTVSATGLGGPPTRLSLSLNPSLLLPDGSSPSSITIQLLDAGGIPAIARERVLIHLSSSNPDVAAVDRVEVTIEPGRHYTTAGVITGSKPGSTIIAAAAHGLEASLATLEVRGPLPSRLSLYAASQILADGEPRDILVLQVQSREGIPLPSPVDLEVYLASSSSLIIEVPPTAKIRRGESYVRIPIKPTLVPGYAEITAHTQGLKASATTINTITLPMNLSLKAPSTAQINQTFTATVTAWSGSRPIKNASLNWGIRGGELISAEWSTGSSGSAQGVIKPTGERLELFIEASKPGYQASRVEKSITILALKPPPEPTVNLFGSEVPISYIIIITAIIIATLVILYLYLRRKRNKMISNNSSN